MRLKAANDIRAHAWASATRRMQMQIGVHRFTATPDEAFALARQLVAAADAIRGRIGQ